MVASSRSRRCARMESWLIRSHPVRRGAVWPGAAGVGPGSTGALLKAWGLSDRPGWPGLLRGHRTRSRGRHGGAGQTSVRVLRAPRLAGVPDARPAESQTPGAQDCWSSWTSSAATSAAPTTPTRRRSSARALRWRPTPSPSTPISGWRRWAPSSRVPTRPGAACWSSPVPPTRKGELSSPPSTATAAGRGRAARADRETERMLAAGKDRPGRRRGRAGPHRAGARPGQRASTVPGSRRRRAGRDLSGRGAGFAACPDRVMPSASRSLLLAGPDIGALQDRAAAMAAEFRRLLPDPGNAPAARTL